MLRWKYCPYILRFQKFQVDCKVLLTQRTLLQQGSAWGQAGQQVQALALLQVRREESSLIGFDRLCWQYFLTLLFSP